MAAPPMDGFSAGGLDPYAVLGLEQQGPAATPDEIKKARYSWWWWLRDLD